MNEAKVQFSQEELLLAKDAGVILTKNAIITKICAMFGLLAEEMKTQLQQASLPPEIKLTNSKISKGENYKGLPYVVLDCPRLFTKENIFAIRTLFWWAHYFSITLHLKGIYKQMFLDRLRKNISLYKNNDFYISVTKDEWLHALHENDYMLLRETDASGSDKIFIQNDFLKLSAKINLSEWNRSPELLMQLFGTILNSLE